MICVYKIVDHKMQGAPGATHRGECLTSEIVGWAQSCDLRMTSLVQDPNSQGRYCRQVWRLLRLRPPKLKLYLIPCYYAWQPRPRFEDGWCLPLRYGRRIERSCTLLHSAELVGDDYVRSGNGTGETSDFWKGFLSSAAHLPRSGR